MDNYDDSKTEEPRNSTKISQFKYIENFTSKNWKYSDEKKTKKTDIFHISAQNSVGIH